MLSLFLRQFSEEREHILITTVAKEKYRCIVPKTAKDSSYHSKIDADGTYNGPSEIDLLRPLFNQKTCSYRVSSTNTYHVCFIVSCFESQIETYWTYELCHGRFLRQYHEEKDSGLVSVILQTSPSKSLSHCHALFSPEQKTQLQEYYLGYYTKEQMLKGTVPNEKDIEESGVRK